MSAAVAWGQRAKVAAVLTWSSYGAMLVLLAADAIQREVNWIGWLVRLLPLVMFLPGMLRDHLRSFIWVCFVSLGYFTVLVERLFALPGDPIGVMQMVSVVTLFIAGMLYVRWRARHLAQAREQEQ